MLADSDANVPDPRLAVGVGEKAARNAGNAHHTGRAAAGVRGSSGAKAEAWPGRGKSGPGGGAERGLEERVGLAAVSPHASPTPLSHLR